MQGARDEERWEGEAQSAETEWIDDVGIERPSAREDGDLRARHAQLQERQVPREATAPDAGRETLIDYVVPSTGFLMGLLLGVLVTAAAHRSYSSRDRRGRS